MGITGLIAVNKEQGPTSRYVTGKVSRILGTKQAGHTGTLDPLATGVLPVMLGRACKLIQFLPDKKEYIATFRFGFCTDTGDITGAVLEEKAKVPSLEEINSAVGLFSGEIMQKPPMYSALKKNGVPLYEYARKNIQVETAPRKVRIDSIELLSFEGNEAKIKVACGGGTYIRTLCEDIAKECSCLAAMTALERTMDAGIPLSLCVSLNELENNSNPQSLVIGPEELFSHLGKVEIEDSGVNYFCNGGVINKERLSCKVGNELFSVYNKKKEFLGLGAGKNGALKAVWVNIKE